MLLIAAGADYRELDVEGCDKFEGRGVYYAATLTEALLCQGSEVAVVGGGNSAGQAVVFLSRHVRKVYLVVRGKTSVKSMSSYLSEAHRSRRPISRCSYNTEVRRMSGNSHLGSVEIVTTVTGEVRTLAKHRVCSASSGRSRGRTGYPGN